MVFDTFFKKVLANKNEAKPQKLLILLAEKDWVNLPKAERAKPSPSGGAKPREDSFDLRF